jgi:hypothetical protein
MVILVCSLIAVAAVGFTLYVRERDVPPLPVENPELKLQEARRQVLYDNLKDLQFEYHQGKLSEEDYQSLKQGFLYDLAGVMDSIERLGLSRDRSTGPTAPVQPAQRKQKPTAPAPEKQVREPDEAPLRTSIAITESVACPACAAPNPPGNRFCGGCGQRLS